MRNSQNTKLILSNKNRRKKGGFFRVLALLSVPVGSIVIIFYGSGYSISLKDVLADRVSKSPLSVKDADLLTALQREIDKIQVVIQLNGNPIFENGHSEGSLYLGNPEINIYDMHVTISSIDTNELLYDSGLIPPSHVIEYDALLIPLEAGNHLAEATVIYYDDENIIATSKFEINLTVLN